MKELAQQQLQNIYRMNKNEEWNRMIDNINDRGVESILETNQPVRGSKKKTQLHM